MAKRHGLTNTGAWRSWVTITHRCNNPKEASYALYGGRGISVCERWSVFENFLEDMGERPAGMSLDRINPDGNYEPGNCRWASSTTQNRNRRNNVLLTHEGETRCLSDWAEVIGMHQDTLRKRIVSGWPVDLALSTPLGAKRFTNRLRIRSSSEGQALTQPGQE